MSSSQDGWEAHPLNKHHRAVLETIPNSWMLRECDVYKDEYKACSSMKGKLYSYYINGKIRGECDNWKQNYQDCKLWVDNTDESAAKRIIEREEKRIFERLKGHYQNDIWETRSEDERPPPEWNKPLPDHLADASEDSYLKQYKENLEKGSQDDAHLKLRALTSKAGSSLEGCIIL